MENAVAAAAAMGASGSAGSAEVGAKLGWATAQGSLGRPAARGSLGTELGPAAAMGASGSAGSAEVRAELGWAAAQGSLHAHLGRPAARGSLGTELGSAAAMGASGSAGSAEVGAELGWAAAQGSLRAHLGRPAAQRSLGAARVSAESRSNIVQLVDAIAALTLDETRSLLDHLQDRLGVFASAFLPGVFGHGWRATASEISPTTSLAEQGDAPKNSGFGCSEHSADDCSTIRMQMANDLFDVTEENARKPELSELKEVKEQILLAIREMTIGAEGITDAIKVLQSCNLDQEKLDSLTDDLSTIAQNLESQANYLRPSVYILRERPKLTDWDFPSTPTWSSDEE